MTLVLIGKGLVLGGLTFKNRGHWGPRHALGKFRHGKFWLQEAHIREKPNYVDVVRDMCMLQTAIDDLITPKFF